MLKKGLIVSCQALEDEPLYSSFIMGKMALAAKEASKKTFIEDIFGMGWRGRE